MVAELLCVHVAGDVSEPLVLIFKAWPAPSPSGLLRSFVKPVPVNPVQLDPQAESTAMNLLLLESDSATPAQEVHAASLKCWLGVVPESTAMFPKLELTSHITPAQSAPAAQPEPPVAVIVIEVCPLALLRQ